MRYAPIFLQVVGLFVAGFLRTIRLSLAATAIALVLPAPIALLYARLQSAAPAGGSK